MASSRTLKRSSLGPLGLTQGGPPSKAGRKVLERIVPAFASEMTADLETLKVEGDMEDAASETSSDGEVVSNKNKAPVRHLARQIRAQADSWIPVGGGKGPNWSVLEDRSVVEKVKRTYLFLVQLFIHFAKQKNLPMFTDPDVDGAIVAWMNVQYALGESFHIGEKMLAGWKFLYPDFGKDGSRKLPRVLRSLKGWRKLMPAVARSSTPWAVVAFIALMLARAGRRAMALWVLVGFGNYFRPATSMRMRKCDLIPPKKGVSEYCCFLTHPQEMCVPSKTGTWDESVKWDVKHLMWMSRAFAILVRGEPQSPLWPFTYLELCKEIAKVTKRWGIQFVPYQLRHAGPAHDRLENARSQEEVQKRGGWKAQRSMVRYEKSARVSADFAALEEGLQRQCLAAPALLQSAILG